jgi:putative membrane protein
MGKIRNPCERSVFKGALAGLLGGIAGTGAKMLATRICAPQAGQPEISSLPNKPELEDAKPWIVGAVAGTVYGAAMEIEPKAGVWGGAGFGLGLRRFAGTALDVSKAQVPVRQRTRQLQSEWVSYAVFGIVTEAVRRVVRKGL